MKLLLFGSDVQKQKYLPEIAAGRKLIAFGLSEKASGSDAGSGFATAGVLRTSGIRRARIS